MKESKLLLSASGIVALLDSHQSSTVEPAERLR
jgi:hypothetical protein